MLCANREGRRLTAILLLRLEDYLLLDTSILRKAVIQVDSIDHVVFINVDKLIE